MGIVQTGYANCARKQFLEKKGAKIEQVPTGVKNMHFKAAEFDIGIYFGIQNFY